MKSNTAIRNLILYIVKNEQDTDFADNIQVTNLSIVFLFVFIIVSL